MGVDIYEATYLGGFPAFSCEKKGKPWVGPPVREGKQSINSYPPPFLLPLSLTRRGRLASPEAAARFPSRTASAIWVSRSADGRVSAAELANAIARVNREAPSDIAAQLVLQALDVDHAGAITREEAQRVEPGKD